jgi:hypothetical protein
MVISMSRKKNKKHRNNKNYAYYEKMWKPANSSDINRIAVQVFGSLYFSQQYENDDIINT